MAENNFGGEISPVNFEEERQRRSSAIVKSILEKGLLSGEAQSQDGEGAFSSNDKAENKSVSGYRVGAGTSLEDAFTKNYFSIFPVLAERNKETDQETRELPAEVLEERFKNSFLVVVPFSKLDESQLDVSTEAKNASKFGEARVKGISRNQMTFILMPEDIYATMQSEIQSANVKIIPVGSTTRTVFDKQCAVPDYERKVSILTLPDNESGTVPPLPSNDYFIHAVRLPTISDIKNTVQ